MVVILWAFMSFSSLIKFLHRKSWATTQGIISNMILQICVWLKFVQANPWLLMCTRATWRVSIRFIEVRCVSVEVSLRGNSGALSVEINPADAFTGVVRRWRRVGWGQWNWIRGKKKEWFRRSWETALSCEVNLFELATEDYQKGRLTRTFFSLLRSLGQ